MSSENFGEDHYEVFIESGSSRRSLDDGESTTIWSCLVSCWAILYHYFIRACCHRCSACRCHYCKYCGTVTDGEDPEKSVHSRDREMKERLQKHFQSHLQKWMDKHQPRFPWKAVLHILLVGLVTAQGVIYASETRELTHYLKENMAGFRQYFTPVSKVYTLHDVYDQISHIVMSYYNISNQYVISYTHTRDENNLTGPPTLIMNITVFDDVECDGERISSRLFTELFSPTLNDKIDNTVNTTSKCICSTLYCNCSVIDQIKSYINETTIGRIKIVAFNFNLYTYFKEHIIDYSSVLADIIFSITLENDLYSGVTVETHLDFTLNRNKNDNSCKYFRVEVTILDVIVLLALTMSSLTYLNSIVIAVKLSKDVRLYFLAVHEKHLRWQQISVLFNKWYLLMLLTNLWVFCATTLKIISEYKDAIDLDFVESVRILLGVGLLLLWCGLFGLIKYFEPFNVLFITVTLAIPSVLRFLFCFVILFVAFALCGWLVLGPYHPKFTTFWLSLESLFTILNGDDLYETFEENNSTFLFEESEIFSRIYLALFIFLFIYVVLSLFIGIFSHAYESLSDDWRKRSRGFLRDWAEGEPDDDPTKNYPFPVPPVRKPVDDTAIVINDNNITAFEISNIFDNDVNNVTVPTIEVTQTSDDHTLVRSSSRSRVTNVKLQVAEPPNADKREVKEARQRLTVSNKMQRTATEEINETEA